MKIRTGFVSNSSSTSFCLVGYYFSSEQNAMEHVLDNDEIAKIKADYKEQYKHEADVDDIVGALMPDGRIECLSNAPDGGVYIGQSIDDMKDDQTLGQFKNDVYERLKQVFDCGHGKIGVMIDGWADY